MSTIAYYGDSFCASDKEDSWCVILADLLSSKIQRLGVGGSSIWHTFLDFDKDQKANNLADYIVFCWTDSNRLYHPTLPLTVNNKPIPGTDTNIWKAADSYYKYLSFEDKDDIAYKYALQFFDQNVLQKVDEQAMPTEEFIMHDPVIYGEVIKAKGLAEKKSKPT